MKKITYILLFVVGALQAQTFSLPSQLDRNLIYVNSAFAGMEEATLATLMHRSQYVGGFDGAPTYQNFELHAPLKKQNIALGIQAKHEGIGTQNNTELFFSYAHRIRMESATLALSLKAGGQSLNTAENDLIDTELDPTFSSSSAILPNGGVGIAFYSPDYYFGLAVPYFFKPVRTEDGAQLNFDANHLEYVLSAGGSIKLNNKISLEPLASFYYSMSLPYQLTGVLNANFADLVIAGVGYRLDEGIIFNAGFKLNEQFSVVYSYDHIIGDASMIGTASHELSLQYYFGYKVNTISPRDF